MKKKLLILLFSVFMFIPYGNLNAVSSSEVDYTIKDIFIESDIDIAGSLNVKELIVLSGTFNGYVRDLEFANTNLKKFTGKSQDFEGSDIYNGSGIAKLKVGTVKLSSVPKFDDLGNKVTYFKEGTSLKNGDSGKYEITEGKNKTSVKIYNENKGGYAALYLEYVVTNVAVKHKDVAEFYWNYIGNGFTDEIENLEIRTFLPYEGGKDVFKFWAHGPLNGSISKVTDNMGVVLKCNNLSPNTPVDIRMTYDKESLPICLFKNTEVKALDKIMNVEQKRADDANQKRKLAKLKVTIFNLTSVVYIALLLVIGLYIYIKFDRELKSEFNEKYYREINDSYPVEVVEYIMNHNVTGKALTSSLLNLIYKKKLEIEETKKKKEYILKIKDIKNLTKAEEKLLEAYFKDVKVGASINTKDMKKIASKESFYNDITDWKNIVKAEAEKCEFYYTEDKFKVIGVLYAIIGLILFILNFLFGIGSILPVLAFILTIIFVIYIFSFTKKTAKGNLEFHKWKAFRNFLKDFGRFDEKELPEVKLWDKLIVYAAVFGIAKEVQKEMKVKLKEINPNYTNDDLVFNYLLYRDFTSDIHDSVASSLTTSQVAHSQMSSGSGTGGGFSSGGGFGGGGGGGHGF